MFVDLSPPEPVANMPVKSPRDALYWILILINAILMISSLLLSSILTTVLLVDTLKRVKVCSQKITLPFLLTIIVSSICDLSNLICLEILRYDVQILDCTTLVISLITSYYMTTLIFLLGLNRFAAFCSQRLNEEIMRSKRLFIIIFALLILSIIIGIAVYLASGFTRSYDVNENMIVTEASNTVLLMVSNYMFYTIPLISTVFYFLCFLSLRSKSSRLYVVIIILLLISIFAGVAVYELTGLTKGYDATIEGMTTKSENSILLTVSNHIFYTIPLASSVFYWLCYRALRSQRSMVRTEATLSLLNRAERASLKQGIVILFFYSVSFPLFDSQKLSNLSVVADFAHYALDASFPSTQQHLVLRPDAHRNSLIYSSTTGNSTEQFCLLYRDSASLMGSPDLPAGQVLGRVRLGKSSSFKKQHLQKFENQGDR
ncbi:unnamed protein product [Cylicocyclus nassatus]|uniref:Uncharacterized protein n=1 Tax=Cylicocyclus nassatus TaxID=53992 RepID=A0AA36GPW7_CYLNA|nr:unnamed protein product [Cylicocyclus nassatus]